MVVLEDGFEDLKKDLEIDEPPRFSIEDAMVEKA